MILCLCMNVNTATARACESLEVLTEQSGATTCCGACKEVLEAFYEDKKENATLAH